MRPEKENECSREIERIGRWWWWMAVNIVCVLKRDAKEQSSGGIHRLFYELWTCVSTEAFPVSYRHHVYLICRPASSPPEEMHIWWICNLRLAHFLNNSSTPQIEFSRGWMEWWTKNSISEGWTTWVKEDQRDMFFFFLIKSPGFYYWQVSFRQDHFSCFLCIFKALSLSLPLHVWTTTFYFLSIGLTSQVGT